MTIIKNLSGAYSPGLIEVPGAPPCWISSGAYPGLIAPASLKSAVEAPRDGGLVMLIRGL